MRQSMVAIVVGASETALSEMKKTLRYSSIKSEDGGIFLAGVNSRSLIAVVFSGVEDHDLYVELKPGIERLKEILGE